VLAGIPLTPVQVLGTWNWLLCHCRHVAVLQLTTNVRKFNSWIPRYFAWCRTSGWMHEYFLFCTSVSMFCLFPYLLISLCLCNSFHGPSAYPVLQRMNGAIPPLPHYTFMAWCLVKHRDNFTFTFSLCLCNTFHEFSAYAVLLFPVIFRPVLSFPLLSYSVLTYINFCGCSSFFHLSITIFLWPVIFCILSVRVLLFLASNSFLLSFFLSFFLSF
jgi:hypothetical protein